MMIASIATITTPTIATTINIAGMTVWLNCTTVELVDEDGKTETRVMIFWGESSYIVLL